MPEDPWQISLHTPTLSRGEVHIWRIFLDQPLVEAKNEWLSPEEQARADRFIQAEHRRRFIVAHVGLRVILSRYLQELPQHVRLEQGSHGKPYVTIASQASFLQFNLSHTHELSLCAVAWDQSVGVDVEWIHLLPHEEVIAERFFSREETEALCALPSTERLRGFYRYWTCKEAYIKALGLGLSLNFNRLTERLVPEGSLGGLVWVDPSLREDIQRWSLGNVVAA